MVDSAEIDAFIQSSPYPAWLASSNSECVYVNPALERLTGRNSDQLTSANTALVFRNGMFRTGDIGYQDSHGYFYILDRLKDMIVTGGENVYSGEVEAVIYKHPAVREAAVFGIPDCQWGELVMACVVLKFPGAIATAYASRKVLAKAGLSLAQMGVFELNEAFASQALAVLRDLGIPDDTAHA